MEYEKKEFKNKNELEFFFLEEIEEEVGEESCQNLNNIFSLLDDISCIDSVMKVIKKTDEGIILSDNEKFILVKNSSNFEIGDVCSIYNNHICKIDKELINTEKFKELFVEVDKWVEEGYNEDEWKNPRNYGKDLIGVVENDIDVQFIKDKINEHIKEREDYEEEEKKRKEEEEKKVKENTAEEDYNIGAKVEFRYFNTSGKILTSKSGWKKNYDFILDKDVNKLISYKQITDYYSTGDNLRVVEYLLNSLNISYTKKDGISEQYKVKYTDDKCKINGVSTPKSKILFVLFRMDGNTTNEDIKILIKLNGMKADFIGITKIGLCEVCIPISNKVIDDKTFEIEFLEKKKIFNWDGIKELFFYRGSRRIDKYFGKVQVLNFCSEMGITKEELFRAMKRIKMLKTLEDKK